MELPKVVVTISRKWHNPKIATTISQEGIALSVPLDDFIEATIREVGSIALTLRRASFDAQLRAAVGRVLSGIKAESTKAV